MIVLYKRGATGLTGRLLAKLLGGMAWDGERLVHTTSPHYKRLVSAAKDGLLLRWGSDRPLESDTISVKHELNRRDAVALARNKEKALRVMSEAKIRVPRFVDGKAPKTGAIGRTTYHQSGEGLTVFSAGQELRGSAYYLELIPSIGEYRVHVVGGEVIATQKKVLQEGQSGDSPIRNYNNGWRFVRILERGWLTPHAVGAVKALGMDFGAVDILHSKDHHVYVLEVNTAPGLDGTMPERYVEALRKLCHS